MSPEAAQVIPIDQKLLQPTTSNPIAARDGHFLRENWKKVISNDCPDKLRLIRSISGVLTITNGTLMIRQYMGKPDGSPLLPDGAYQLNDSNEFTAFTPNHWLTYPDVELSRPRFADMVRLRLMAGHAQEVLPRLEAIKQVEGTVVFCSKGFYCRQNPQAPELSWAFPCEIAGLSQSVEFSPQLLTMAFKEMLRYDDFYIGRQEVVGRDTPLVLGHNWGYCALVMPLSRRGGY